MAFHQHRQKTFDIAAIEEDANRYDFNKEEPKKLLCFYQTWNLTGPIAGIDQSTQVEEQYLSSDDGSDTESTEQASNSGSEYSRSSTYCSEDTNALYNPWNQRKSSPSSSTTPIISRSNLFYPSTNKHLAKYSPTLDQRNSPDSPYVRAPSSSRLKFPRREDREDISPEATSPANEAVGVTPRAFA